MPVVTLYTRKDCHLCDRAKTVLDEARRQSPFDFREIDIDSDPDLRARYNVDIPVIAIDGEEAFRHRVALPDLLRKLAARA